MFNIRVYKYSSSKFKADHNIAEHKLQKRTVSIH